MLQVCIESTAGLKLSMWYFVFLMRPFHNGSQACHLVCCVSCFITARKRVIWCAVCCVLCLSIADCMCLIMTDRLWPQTHPCFRCVNCIQPTKNLLGLFFIFLYCYINATRNRTSPTCHIRVALLARLLFGDIPSMPTVCVIDRYLATYNFMFHIN